MRRGKEGQCFSNAGRIIRREGKKKPYLRYCEGFYFCDSAWGAWTHHAWIEDSRTGTIHEVTMPAYRCGTDQRHLRFTHRAIIRLNWEDYSEAGWPAGYESIMLPCKHIGCECDSRSGTHQHGGGIDDSDTKRLDPRRKP